MDTTRYIQNEQTLFDPHTDFEEKHLDAMRWLHATASGLVDDPSRVYIEVTVTDQSSAFQLRVGAEDIGKVVGKSGRNARALRGLFFAIGKRVGARFELDIRAENDPALKARAEILVGGRIELGCLKLADTVGMCAYCHCTYLKPCHLASGTTCSWANAEHTLCSNPECSEAQKKSRALLAMANETVTELLGGGPRA